jgi:penicillin amidase
VNSIRKPRPRIARRAARVLAAVVASVVVLGVLGYGFGPVPALGQILNPGRGVWASAAGGVLPHSQSLDVPGLKHLVSVSYDAQGVPSIRAEDETDVYLAQGYVEASFRLTQMDLARRLGKGELSQLDGPSYLSSDEFELRLGLLRTAEAEWAQTQPSSPAGQELTAYSRGVNDYIAHVRATGAWPALFTLTGVYPAAWTPVDSLVIQEVLTQELDFTTWPLDYALIQRALGAARTLAWFPVEPANSQSPFDPPPYKRAGITPIAADAASSAGTADAAVPSSVGTTAVATQKVTSGVAAVAGSLLAEIGGLPAGQIHEYSDSNAWAVNGPAAGGGSILAGDPHLTLTLPSLWYQLVLESPGFAVTGANVPGMPGILIGHNAHIAWSLTGVQNQATFFYAEQTSKSHPGEYYWQGHWRHMLRVSYVIDVRGGAPVRLTVDITVHGPIMTQADQTMAVDWMGNIPSPDVAAMSRLDRADDYAQFRAALADWKAPTQNFLYADDAGNIGSISAGYYPQVVHGDPWLPMPGTGADDIVGVIPYSAIPQVYDPPDHMIVTANQRPVGPSYPYYIGTSADFFDPGYRAGEIYAYLRGHPATMNTFAALQGNVVDSLASEIVPSLLAALRTGPALTGTDRAAMQELADWNDAMNPDSAAATIWYTFWSDYITAVFQPWWNATRVPVNDYPGNITPLVQGDTLGEDLQAWTHTDPDNPAFTPPGVAHRTATQVMRAAFAATVAQLSGSQGRSPDRWTWGTLHSTQIQSLTGTGPLGYGPVPSAGDKFTVDAADGYPVTTDGPSWRMLVQWTAPGQSTAEYIYPGGQSENPASPWYSDLITDWREGRYLPMSPADGRPAGTIEWSLLPGGAS